MIQATRDGQIIAWGVTDTAGRFELELAPGEYDVQAPELNVAYEVEVTADNVTEVPILRPLPLGHPPTKEPEDAPPAATATPTAVPKDAGRFWFETNVDDQKE